MRKEFSVHKLNDVGMKKAVEMAASFDTLLANLERHCTPTTSHAQGQAPGGRELALARTHLEIASFFAKKAMALQPENQE